MANVTEGHDFDEVKRITDFLKSKTSLKPSIGIICGSGLGGLVGNVTNQEEFKYEDIPEFPVSTVAGHAGKLVFGNLSGKTVVCLQGRFHFYEGYGIHKSTIAVRVLISLGIKSMIVTNAAGGVNQSFKVGDIMVIQDHIGFPLLSGQNPLVGKNDERFGPRFPSLNTTYDKDYQKTALELARTLGYGDFIRHGVYCMVSGPCYETPAEIRLVKAIGGDAVGMSTVPEVVVAGHMGVKCLGISLITNECVHGYENQENPHHEEVLKVAKQRSECVLNIVTQFVEKL